MRIAPAFFRRRRWPSRSWSSVETRAELGSKPLVWVLWESNGYPNDVELPSCRMLPMTLKGNFTGVAWKGEGIIIPLGVVPEKVRKDFKKYQLRQSIAVVQQLVNRSEEFGRLEIPIGDLAFVIGGSSIEEARAALRRVFL
jgi:predicted transcriptional regulator with HTH domain